MSEPRSRTTGAREPDTGVPIAGSVAACRALVKDALSILDELGPQEWSAASACRGWRVQDVVTHMAFFLHSIAEPRLALPPNPLGTAEALNDAAVAERAHWSARQAHAYYRNQAEAGLAALELLQGADLRMKPIRLCELGTYQLAQLADAVAFDHLVHLTCDLLLPHGPLAQRQVNIAIAIDPAIDWMVAGLPNMCGGAVRRVLRGPLGLRLIGETERSFVIDRAPGGDDALVVTETVNLPPDTVTTAATDFLRWATARSDWRPTVTIVGSSERVFPVLDAIRII